LWWTDKAKLGFARANINSLINSRNYSQAKEGFDKLVAEDFSTHEDWPATLYWIAREFGGSNLYEEEMAIYRQIVQNYPDNLYANKARLGLSRANVLSLIMSQDYNQADIAFDKMIADFAGHPDLSSAILGTAEPYYNKALRLEGEGLQGQAKECFRKALRIAEIAKDKCPNYVESADTLFWTGVCYRALGDYEKSIECCQKVVDNWPDYTNAWQAQFLIGCNYEELKTSGAVSEVEANTKAKAAYEELLKNYPGCPASESARTWLNLRNSEK
jgi:tetratricopeptide (TPR) repeat protein